jgi:parvulin-like peptidyl-prolyl isomerase
MKRLCFATLLLAVVLVHAGAQTTIDKPAATIKLQRQEIVSVRQLKADVEKLQKVLGKALEKDMIRQILDARINSLLFVQYCEREKIVVSDAEIAKTLASMKTDLGAAATDADLENALRAEGVFVDPKTYVRQRLLFTAYLQARKTAELKAASGIPAAEEILKAYDLSKSSLVRPDTMRVSVIYVDIRGKSPEDTKKGSETIKGIAAALKADGDRFDEFMLKGNEAGSGYKAIPSLYVEKTSQNRTMFGPEFFDTVFKLKSGDISAVVESSTGYRIVRANDFQAQKQLTLSDTVPGNPNLTVQEFLAYQVAQRKQTELMDKFEADLIAQLRKEATIKVFEENLVF